MHLRSSRPTWRIVLTVLSIVLAGAVANVVTAPAAQAAPEQPPHCFYVYNKPNGEGAGEMTGTYNLKIAPYSDCWSVQSVSTGTRLWFHCWLLNDFGNLWWYVRIAGTETYGWMSNDNMKNLWYNDDGDWGYEPEQCTRIL